MGIAPPDHTDRDAVALFAGPGEMRARCRTLDWGATPLGPVATWPPALRAAARLCLDCGFPSSVYGGPDLVLVYNDAYVAALGEARHPGALGRPSREVWPEATALIAQHQAALLAGGPPLRREDVHLVVERDGRPEETRWTYALSLVRADDGRVVGMLSFGLETSARMRAETALREREARQRFLLALSDALRALTDPAAIQTTASRLLAEHLGADRALYAENDDEAGAEYGTIRGQYVGAATPFPPRFDYRAFGEHVVERYQRGEPVVVADVLADADYDAEARAAWTATELRAAVGVSLVKGGRFVASFGVLSAAARAWTADEVALVQETAERTWEAAERARAEAARDRLLERERQARAEADAARDRTERLQRLSAELTRNPTPDAVIDVVVRHLVLALGARAAGVYELSADGREFRLLGSVGVDAGTRERFTRVPVDTPLPLGEMMRTGAAVLVEDSSAWRATRGDMTVMPGDDVRAWAALPLRVDEGPGERVLGALTVTLPGPRRFDDEDRGFLQAFGDLCAQSLERARLVEAEHARVAAEAARAEAEAARAAAEAASRAKDELLAVVSHELRSPLAPARALAQALARGDVPPAEAREMAAEIDRHIAYEARLIADLLDYQRAARGQLTVQRRPCDVHEIARRALHVAGPLLHAKGMSVTEAFAAPDPMVWADPMRVQQILFNLLANAATYSRDHAPVVIRTGNPAPERVELAVVDAGSGIARDVLGRLFEPFVRGGSRQDARAGLGLGLALSRRLAELQGGTLTAASDGRGLGATFTLQLPTAHAGRAASPAPDATPSDAASGPQAVDPRADGPLRVLVLEDDATAARALRRLLALEGFVVHVADSLAAADRIAGAEPLDVVLADLQLGSESGLAAPRRLAEAARRNGRVAPPAIVLSGYDRDSDVAESRAAGFVAHLAKPVDEQALLQAVRRAVDGRSS